MRARAQRLRMPLVGRSLRARLALTFALAVLPTAAVGAVALDRLNAAQTRSTASAREAAAVSRLQSLLARASDPSAARRLSPRIDAVLATRGSFTGPVRLQAARLARRWHAAEAALRQGANASFRRELRRTDAASERLAAAETKEQNLQAAAAGRNRQDLAYLAGAIGIALLLGTLAAWRLAAVILRPLGRLREAAAFLGREQLGTGVRVPVEREDEIGDLARSLNDLAERLATTRKELTRQALHDSLTLLPNRGLLAERVQEALERARRSRRPPVLLWISLDNFEALRGSLGRELADRILRALAERIAGCARPGDTAARIGGAEFAVLLEDLATADDAAPRVERVLDAVRRRLDVAGSELIVRASVGVARAEPGSRDSDELFRGAVLAMQAARAQGGDRYTFFAPEMQVEASDRLSLEADLREAIERGRLTLNYQPLYDLRSGTISGLEALVRWTHPERGPISPGTFIPLAEETGLIEPLGLFVLSEACMDALRLRRRGGHVPVGVNLSRRQLDQPQLVEDVSRILSEKRFDPSGLVLEVTESVLADDASSAIERLAELRALGIKIALDDFGTGYSSLSSLRTLPIDIVKIDRSFISDLRADDPASLEFVRTVVGLCRALGLRTVAEGIEQEEQVHVLRSLECDEGQGFHLAKPMELGRVNRLLAEARLGSAGSPALVS